MIEVNQKCNISCTACYKDKFNYTKPLDQIKEEIDFAASVRKLRIITLAGGEPSLHPDLPEIIRYIRSKGIEPQMLSNGFSLTPEILAKYKKAGLGGIFLHVDSLQRRADVRGKRSETELNELRTQISDKIAQAGITCYLVITLYQKTLSEFPGIIHYALGNPNITKLLVTCYTDFDAIHRDFKKTQVLEHTFTNRNAIAENGTKVAPETPPELLNQSVSCAEVKSLLHENFGMSPVS